MSALDCKGNQKFLDAIADFQQARDQADLWSLVHKHLANFGIGGIWYGFEMLPQQGSFWRDRKNGLILCSLPDGYVDDKIGAGFADDDYYYRAAKTHANPIVWGDVSKSNKATPEEKRSFQVDCDYGILTGVTIPGSFASGMGMTSFSCHAPDMSWAEFDRLWAEHAGAIQRIACAFDVCLRENHMTNIFPLSAREREVLLWLAKGLRPPRIAFQLSLHEGTVEKHIQSARLKLRASNAAQAVAMALIFGLLSF